MNTIAASYSATPHLLRYALLADALASGATGALMAFAASPLAGLLGLPASLLFWAGWSLLPFAAWLIYLAKREPIPRRMAWAVVACNAVWAVDSLLLLASGWIEPNLLGYVFVGGQALVVAVFAQIQFLALRRSRSA